MPTYESTHSFLHDYEDLTPTEQEAFMRAVEKLVDDLRGGEGFRPGLRVKRVKGTNPGLYEMTWAKDGRAVFKYGDEQLPGDPHVIWLAIGGHDDVFRDL